MKLNVKMLDGDKTTVNSLFYQNQTIIDPGESPTIMFQLVDDDSGNRYMPAPGATLQITLFSMNDANTITKIPTMPFTLDSSIWQFGLSAIESQTVAGVNMLIVLTEGANIRKIWAKAVFIVKPSSPYKT
jgi:hypothetical protein